MTSTDAQAFVLRHTRPQHPPHVPEVRLHLADQVLPLWHLVEARLGVAGVPPPFWAFAWAGGQAVARYLLDHPAEAAGRHVVDFATGCGLCAIAALKAGAASALAADVDPFSGAAVTANARMNEVRVAFTAHDLLCGDPPAVDLILAGDVCYEQALAARALAWLRTAHTRGARVLIGDPGRTYFPRGELVRLAEYRVPTTRELEDAEDKRVGVFTFPA